MDDITLIVTPSQLKSIAVATRFLRDHCDEILSGIANIKPLTDPTALPATPVTTPTSPTTAPTSSVEVFNG